MKMKQTVIELPIKGLRICRLDPTNWVVQKIRKKGSWRNMSYHGTVANAARAVVLMVADSDEGISTLTQYADAIDAACDRVVDTLKGVGKLTA